MANKAERIMVANFMSISERIEKYADSMNQENTHYKRLQDEYNRQRRDLVEAFDTRTI